MHLYLFNRNLIGFFFQILGILDEIVSPFPNNSLYNFRLSNEKKRRLIYLITY